MSIWVWYEQALLLREHIIACTMAALPSQCYPTWLWPGHPMTSLLDPKALHQLHALIFCIAVFHVLYVMAVMFVSQVSLTEWFRELSTRSPCL